MAELTEQQKLEIHNKLYQAGKGMIPVQELTYAASQLCKDNSEANQVEVLRNLKQFSMPGVGTSSTVETIAAEAVRDACDREQPIEEITEEMGVNEWWAEEVRKRRPKNYCPIEGELEVGNTVIFGKYMQAAGSLESGQKDPFEWYVLQKDIVNGKALLLSKNVLAVKTWGQNLPYLESGIYSWLHNEFLPNAFDDTELDFIMDTDLDNLGPNNPTSISNEKVFLLSYNEYKALINDAEPICFGTPTEYCKELAVAENANPTYGNNGTLVSWWLRTSGTDKNWGNLINYVKTGSTSTYLSLNYAKFTKAGIRPAIWVKL